MHYYIWPITTFALVNFYHQYAHNEDYEMSSYMKFSYMKIYTINNLELQ